MPVNINNNEQQYKRPGVGAIIGGAFAGGMVNNLISMPHRLMAPKIMDKLGDISRNLSPDEFQQVDKAIAKTIENSGLADKGVSIIKATAENADEIIEITTKELDRGILKYLPKRVKEFVGTLLSLQMASGKNACYTFASKKIIMPEKELCLALFHEAGHAVNANLSKIGKILQGCRNLTLLMLPISLIALWKTKKAPNEEPKNKLDKATTFVKNNAGKLTFATFIPLLIEEGMATIKGNKFAKKLLNPELARKVAKTNALGFSTYLMLATLSGLGIFLGTKVKDAIAKPKLAENK